MRSDTNTYTQARVHTQMHTHAHTHFHKLIKAVLVSELCQHVDPISFTNQNGSEREKRGVGGERENGRASRRERV